MVHSPFTFVAVGLVRVIEIHLHESSLLCDSNVTRQLGLSSTTYSVLDGHDLMRWKESSLVEWGMVSAPGLRAISARK
jgi:hypothetical protein